MEDSLNVRSFRPKIVTDLTSGGRGRGRGRGKMVWGGGTGPGVVDPVRRSTRCIQTLRLENPENFPEVSQISALIELELGHQVHKKYLTDLKTSCYKVIFRRTL